MVIKPFPLKTKPHPAALFYKQRCQLPWSCMLVIPSLLPARDIPVLGRAKSFAGMWNFPCYYNASTGVSSEALIVIFEVSARNSLASRISIKTGFHIYAVNGTVICSAS
ncbi:MAG: hypothetical protein FIB07_05450 [Candidatus Methanoperedens sp.]|nr:hypothetical protein [Candidatus Methanoperedens sp.]